MPTTCNDPSCPSIIGEHEVSECDCGNDICQGCRKVCDCCGQFIGCVRCMTKDDEAEHICDECLTKCSGCGYKAGLDRFNVNDKGTVCPHCGEVV